MRANTGLAEQYTDNTTHSGGVSVAKSTQRCIALIDTFFAHDINDVFMASDYELLNVVHITIEKDGNQFIVSDDKVDMFGVGGTIDEAKIDFELSLGEYYESLTEDEEHLHDHLKEHLSYLIKLLKPRK